MKSCESSAMVASVIIASQLLGSATIWAAEQRGVRLETDQLVVSAVSGDQLMIENNGSSQSAKFRTLVQVGDRIVTGTRTVAEVLISNRTVVMLDPNTTAQVVAMNPHQTTIQVAKGMVRVSAAASAIGAQGLVCVQTPMSQVQTRGGILRVAVDIPVGKAGTESPSAQAYRASYHSDLQVATTTASGDLIHVEEGTADLAGGGPAGGSLTIQAGQRVLVQAGRGGAASEAGKLGMRTTGIVATSSHTQTPKEGRDHLVALQVTQATQLGKALTGAAETESEESRQKSDQKTIINGATGGKVGAGEGLGNILVSQPTTRTTGTMTFRNSSFNVSSSLVVVDGALTDSSRSSDDTVVSMNSPTGVQVSTPESINAPKTNLILNSFTGDAGVNGATNTEAGFQNIYLVTAGSDPKYALQARLLNDPSPQTPDGNSVINDSPSVTFVDGVNLVNSTLTVRGTAPVNLVNVDTSNVDVTQNPSITFDRNAFSSTSSKLEGSIGAFFSAVSQDPTRPERELKTPIINVSPIRGESLIQLVDTKGVDGGAAIIDKAIFLDRAILLASAPLVSLYGTVAGDTIDNKTGVKVTDNFLQLLNQACVAKSGCGGTPLPADSIVSLNASNLIIANALANISGGSSLTVAHLATLANGSSLTTNTLAQLSGGSSLHVTSGLVSFTGLSNTLTITGTCGGSCATIGSSIPVLLTGGATLANNTFLVSSGYHAFTGTAAPDIKTFADKPLLIVNGAGNRVELGP